MNDDQWYTRRPRNTSQATVGVGYIPSTVYPHYAYILYLEQPLKKLTLVIKYGVLEIHPFTDNCPAISLYYLVWGCPGK